MAKVAFAMISAPFPILVLLMAVMVESASVPDVTIYNLVGYTIQVHCNGQGHDLAMQTITDGQSFQWRFTPGSTRGSTIYTCSFSWPWAGKVQSFSVWDDSEHDCTHCVWRVFKDGFYRNERGRPPVFVRPWLPAF